VTDRTASLPKGTALPKKNTREGTLNEQPLTGNLASGGGRAATRLVVCGQRENRVQKVKKLREKSNENMALAVEKKRSLPRTYKMVDNGGLRRSGDGVGTPNGQKRLWVEEAGGLLRKQSNRS